MGHPEALEQFRNQRTKSSFVVGYAAKVSLQRRVILTAYGQLDIIAKNACALIALANRDQQLFVHHLAVVRRIVDRNDSLHIQLEALDVGLQVDAFKD